MSTPGATPTESSDLTRLEERLTFLYVEHCVVNRDDNALTLDDQRGTIHVPTASLGAILLGPGTNVTHRAVSLLAESGTTAVWVGEEGVRYYAHGRPLARSTRLLQAQVDALRTTRSRLAVARKMYAKRFPDEVTDGMTMQQLRGFEGARVRNAYRRIAQEHGVEWRRRDYDPNDFFSADSLNQALTAATTCLYGVVQAAVVSLGCSPGLGFIHVGKDQSFVFDIADLYKVELAVPVAFAVTAEEPPDLPREVRLRMRDVFRETKIFTRIVHDIQELLGLRDSDITDWNVLELWDEAGANVPAGVNWNEDTPW